MKTKLLKQLIRKYKSRFRLIRKKSYYPAEHYIYSILKDGIIFNPYAELISKKITFSYDVSCDEKEAIESLKDVIRQYAIEEGHWMWDSRENDKGNKNFNKRWKNAVDELCH